MPNLIKARIVGDEAELGPFSTLTVQGCELSAEFTEHEVSDQALAKLKGNRFVEVMVPKAPKPAEPVKTLEPSKPVETAKA